MGRESDCKPHQFHSQKKSEWKTPYDAALESFGENTLKALQLKRISPDEVHLTPKLIRYNR